MNYRLKLKPLLFLLVFIVASLSITTFCLATQENGVKTALNERLSILCQYYDDKIEFDQAKDRLSLIETGDLLKDDVDNLVAFENTDIEPVNSFDLTNIKYDCDKWNNYNGTFTVQWVLNGYFGTEKSTVDYCFNAIKYADTIKLTNIKKI